MDIIERLDGPHEWGYRGLAGEGFIHDPAPNDAARIIEGLRAELKAETDLVYSLMERLKNTNEQSAS